MATNFSKNTYYLDVLSAGRLQIKYAQFGSATCRNDRRKRAEVYHGGLVDSYRNFPSLHKIGTKLLIILLLSKYPETIFFASSDKSRYLNSLGTNCGYQTVPKQVFKYVLSNRALSRQARCFPTMIPCRIRIFPILWQ